MNIHYVRRLIPENSIIVLDAPLFKSWSLIWNGLSNLLLPALYVTVVEVNHHDWTY